MDTNKILLFLISIIIIIFSCSIFLFNSQLENLLFKSNFHDLEVEPQNASYMILGSSYIIVPSNATVVTQVSRVIRDVESRYNMQIPPNHIPESYNELVPWMEGARVAELMKYAGVKVIPATNVPSKKIDDVWYGPDEKGNYIFSLDPGKVRPLLAKRITSNETLIIDTHGMNVLVPEAIKDHASLVIACGDTPGKAKAEVYMAKEGINCYAPCDRFTSDTMGYDVSGIILGSAPIRPLKNKKGAIIGGQPVPVGLNETIIVQTTHNAYPDQYCDTPFRFFSALETKYNIKLNLDVVDANRGETFKIVEEARKKNADVIAVRVLNEKDKKPVEQWLKENKNHRAVLFHSAAYEPGYSLFFQFPDQVTGQDPRPIFIKNVSKTELQKRFNEIRGLWINKYEPLY